MHVVPTYVCMYIEADIFISDPSSLSLSPTRFALSGIAFKIDYTVKKGHQMYRSHTGMRKNSCVYRLLQTDVELWHYRCTNKGYCS